MRQNRGLFILSLAAVVSIAPLGGCRDETAAGPQADAISLGRNAPSKNVIMVEFRQSVSADLADFFSGVTLDFSSAPQPVQGSISNKSYQTKLTPFTLHMEPIAAFYDGKDPQTSAVRCDTEWLETILNAAAANGDSLQGTLKIDAWWDRPESWAIRVQFFVTVDQWEYAFYFPQHGPVEDNLVRMESDHTVLAFRHGHFQFARRELGTKGGQWTEFQACLIDPDAPSNGYIDAEIWVWTP